FRAVTLDGRQVADALVRNGHGRWDGRGEQGRAVEQAETEAQGALRGCGWQNGVDQAPPNLRGPRLAQLDTQSRKSGPATEDPLGSGREAVAPGVHRFAVPVADAQSSALPPQFAQDTVISSGVDTPTNFAFLPDGSMLVTEKKGVVRMLKN